MIAYILVELFSVLFFSFSVGKDFFNQDIVSAILWAIEVGIIILLGLSGIVWSIVTLIRKKRKYLVFVLLAVSLFTLFSFNVAIKMSVIFYSSDKKEALGAKETGQREMYDELIALFNNKDGYIVVPRIETSKWLPERIGGPKVLSVLINASGLEVASDCRLVNPDTLSYTCSKTFLLAPLGLLSQPEKKIAFDQFIQGYLTSYKLKFVLPMYEDFKREFVGSWNYNYTKYGGVGPILIYAGDKFINTDYFSSSILDKYK